MSGLTFALVSQINAARCRRWHGSFPDPSDPWTGADWSNAMQAEAGEAGNVVKKLRRHELGTAGNRKPGDDDPATLRAQLADEIADTFIYLDLLATYYGVDLPAAVVSKFNAISEALDLPERLPDPAPDMGEVMQALDRASQVVDDLCQGRRRWTMSVPADVDHDPDLVISTAIGLARKALAAP